ncbi:MAG: DUF4194 domain-containing protein [Clostridia bacterium]|nr:DUF4194 domain-containing protein [Clostridia bacterium]
MEPLQEEPRQDTGLDGAAPAGASSVERTTALSGVSPVLIALFRGVLYRDEQPALWASLLRFEAQVRDHVAPFGLELILNEAEGYAYLRQRDVLEGEEAPPRLVPRRQLSYGVSLLLALLRKKLAEHDASGGDPRLVLQREEIVDMVRLFLPDTTDEVRLLNHVDGDIRKVVDLGFLRKLRGHEDRYEVRRILAAFVDAQWLAEFEERLAEYREYLQGSACGSQGAASPYGSQDEEGSDG